MDDHADTVADLLGPWSNDGTRLVILRAYAQDETDTRTAVVTVDGGGPGIEIACPPAGTVGVCPNDWEWAPDDATLTGPLVDDVGRPVLQMLADPTTGATRVAPWSASLEWDWQRVAP